MRVRLTNAASISVAVASYQVDLRSRISEGPPGVLTGGAAEKGVVCGCGRVLGTALECGRVLGTACGVR